MNTNEFLIWEQLSQDTIDVKRVYIDIAEDLIAGILLSQIIYWNLPNKEGKTKLRVKKNEELWLAKGREDWWEECRITPKQFDRAIKILEEKNLVEKQIFKFDGNPTTHIKLNLEVLTQCLSVFYQRGKTNLPKGEKRNSPKGKNHNIEYNKEYNKDKSQSVSPDKDNTNYENKNSKTEKQKTDRRTDKPTQIIEQAKKIYGEDIVNQALKEKNPNTQNKGTEEKPCPSFRDTENRDTENEDTISNSSSFISNSSLYNHQLVSPNEANCDNKTSKAKKTNSTDLPTKELTQQDKEKLKEQAQITFGEEVVKLVYDMGKMKTADKNITKVNSYWTYLFKACISMQEWLKGQKPSVNKAEQKNFTHEHPMSELEQAVRRKTLKSYGEYNENMPESHLNDF